MFALPATDEPAWLLSRAAPAHARQPWIEDRRQPGVMAGRLALLSGDAAEPVPLDHPRFGEGWWDVEWHSQCAPRRWTDGRARLPIRTDRPVLPDVALARNGLIRWCRRDELAYGRRAGRRQICAARTLLVERMRPLFS